MSSSSGRVLNAEPNPDFEEEQRAYYEIPGGVIVCPCGNVVASVDFEAHWIKCRATIITCAGLGCGRKGARGDIHGHMAQCHLVPIMPAVNVLTARMDALEAKLEAAKKSEAAIMDTIKAYVDKTQKLVADYIEANGGSDSENENMSTADFLAQFSESARAMRKIMPPGDPQ